MLQRGYILIIAIFMLIATMTGCAAGGRNSMEEVKVPGCYEYSIQIKKDRKIVESGGTYIYGPEGSIPRKLRGVRGGYLAFNDLTMDFKFKDGREFHEKIDIRPLIREMVKKHDIPDVMKTKWKGGCVLIIRIERDRLTMEYEVSEFIKEVNPERMLPNRTYYPVFEKPLNQIKD